MFNTKMFEDVLKEQVKQKKLSITTKDGYTRCIRQLEKICSDQEGPSAGILEAAINSLCAGNKQTGKYITAIKKYEREVLQSPQILLYGDPLSRLRKKQPAALQGKKLSKSEITYDHKVNALRDMKLKLALRLQKQSGLRVAELADLVKSDICFDDASNTLKLRVRNGKGGKARVVTVMQDEYLFGGLKQLMEQKEENQKIFYTAAYIKKQAGERGIQTHDLRRINARKRFRKEITEGASRRESRTAVGHELGHNSGKITNMYLGDEWTGKKEGDGKDE